MKSKRLDRPVLLVGAFLILVAFVAMNIRPFAFGDMRVFNWVAIQSVLTAVGLTMVIGVAIAKLGRRLRRR
jgi:uncharacterized membrane protein